MTGEVTTIWHRIITRNAHADEQEERVNRILADMQAEGYEILGTQMYAHDPGKSNGYSLIVTVRKELTK